MENKTGSQGGSSAGAIVNQNTFIEALREQFNDPTVRKSLATKLHVSESKINVSTGAGNSWDFSIEQQHGEPLKCRLTPSFL